MCSLDNEQNINKMIVPLLTPKIPFIRIYNAQSSSSEKGAIDERKHPKQSQSSRQILYYRSPSANLQPTSKDTIHPYIGRMQYPISIPESRPTANMEPTRSPSRTAYQTQVGDLTIDVPSADRCWDIRIIHACGCPASRRRFGVVLCDQVIRIKQNNHKFPCAMLRCIVGSQIQYIPGQCDNCIKNEPELIRQYVEMAKKVARK
ncbi:hypothetical protein F5Y14DRAFT_404998 [Nemania sp. NC0429]|nr:hypothetical protein F5Y14DRAFT_404998 [Nemania sp. NC0429]